MTVELIPCDDKCFDMSVANKTFFDMVNLSGMDAVIGRQTANDPVNVSPENTQKCKRLLLDWHPSDGWGRGIGAEQMKATFLEFFDNCCGFTTS